MRIGAVSCYKGIITDRGMGCQDILCSFMLTLLYKYLKCVFEANNSFVKKNMVFLGVNIVEKVVLCIN